MIATILHHGRTEVHITELDTAGAFALGQLAASRAAAGLPDPFDTDGFLDQEARWELHDVGVL